MMIRMQQHLKHMGERLLQVRKRLNITQKDFAGELGISGASLSEVEAGNAKPMIEIYYNITKKFKVNQNYLLFGTGDMFLQDDARGISPGENDKELMEFMENYLYYFKNSKLVRTAMMGHFPTFLLDNEATIEKDMKKNKANNL
ncbi:MAG: helix-turn-helix transcriptional regulator [Candidatus Aminicenantes bacterium]|jgi:transcriptional regulator with XRE-family HTH domain